MSEPETKYPCEAESSDWIGSLPLNGNIVMEIAICQRITRCRRILLSAENARKFAETIIKQCDQIKGELPC